MFTFGIILITSLISIICFKKTRLFDDLVYSPRRIIKCKEYYRAFTYAFVHNNWLHLIFNMITLYSFGSFMEITNPWYFLIIYFASMPLSLVYNFYKWRKSYSYEASGASGAICSLLFAFIISNPLATLYLIIIPIPAWLFGLLFIGISLWLIKSGKLSNIGHDVHITGAIVGILFGLLGMALSII